MDDIIRSLFISLGWQHDEASRKKVVAAERKTTVEIETESKKREVFAKKARESLEATAKGFLKFAATAEAVALGVTAAVERMARSFEQAYYASSRTGSSVKEMNAFKYAASQMGSSADEAQSAIEGLAKAQREMPGFAGILRRLGATDPSNLTKSLNDIGPKLAAMPLAQAEAYAKLLHIPENLLLAMRKVEEFRSFEKQSAAKYNILGFDPEKAAKDGQALTQLFRGLYDTVEKLVESIGSKLFANLKGPIADLNTFLLAHGKEIADAIAEIATAIVDLAKGLIEQLPRLNAFVHMLGGWSAALTALSAVISAAFVARVAGLLTGLSGLSILAMPPWVLALLGVGAGAVASAAYLHNHSPGTPQGDAEEPSYGDAQGADKDGPIWGPAKRWWKRNAPGYLGGGEPKGNSDIRARATHGKSQQASDMPAGSSEGSLTSLLDAESKRAGIDPSILRGIRAGESLHGSAYDIGDRNDGPAYGPLQLNVGAGRLGDRFQKETGLDLRDPKTIAAQVHWVSNYIAKRKKANPNYNPGREWFGFHPWDAYTARGTRGESGYAPVPIARPPMATPSTKLAGDADWRNHRGGKVPIPPMTNLSNPFGGFDPAKLRATMGGGQPLGGGTAADQSKTVHISQTNHNHVTGVSDPTAAAGQIGARQDKHSSMLVRNMQSAIV